MFDTYFLMKTNDVIEYAKQKIDFFEKDADLECIEIGDGNLNYIFKVLDRKSGKSIVIKQSSETARISDQFKVSPDRNRIEYEILKIENDLAPGLVPKIYGYDPVMNCFVMEDLSDHIIMRKGLLERNIYPDFAEDISTFMVNTLLLTTDAVMDHKQKKMLVKNFINPDCCEITENLVYTEPFNDIFNRNDPFLPNLDFIRKELYEDEMLRLEAAKMKFDFFQNAQCLIHGDLHTGSIFVKEHSTKIIDPEFAYFGPAGYDVGNVIANLVFAWANADTVIEDTDERKRMTNYLESMMQQSLDLFIKKWKALWESSVTETVAKYTGFKEWYLDGILRDTAGVTGLELCRRTVGIAHVKDLTSIEDPVKRIRAERVCLSMAKRCIFERKRIRTGEDYLELLDWAARRHPRS